MAENNDEVVNPDGNPIEETQVDTIPTEIAPEPNIIADPVVDEIAPNAKPVEVTSVEQLDNIEDPIPGEKLTNSPAYREPVFGEYGYILKENDEGYVSPAENDPHADQPPLGSGLYTVQAADLNAHTELSEQGVQLHDQVAYDSLWVNKWDTGAHDATVRVPWPTPIGAEKAKGITFNG